MSNKTLDPRLQLFEFEHLDETTQGIVRPFHDVAWFMAERLPNNAQRAIAFNKLAEAMDSACRAVTWIDEWVPERDSSRGKAKLEAERKEGLHRALASFIAAVEQNEDIVFRNSGTQIIKAFGDLAGNLGCRVKIERGPMEKIAIQIVIKRGDDIVYNQVAPITAAARFLQSKVEEWA